MKKSERISNIKRLFLLHILLMIFSLGGIFTKTAGKYDFLSSGFCLCYAGMILILGIYAVGWQQIIKRIPLTTAFSNKAITVVWSIIWGAVCFGEKITVGKIIGAGIVMIGIILYASADEEAEDE